MFVMTIGLAAVMCLPKIASAKVFEAYGNNPSVAKAKPVQAENPVKMTPAKKHLSMLRQRSKPKKRVTISRAKKHMDNRSTNQWLERQKTRFTQVPSNGLGVNRADDDTNRVPDFEWRSSIPVDQRPIGSAGGLTLPHIDLKPMRSVSSNPVRDSSSKEVYVGRVIKAEPVRWCLNFSPQEVDNPVSLDLYYVNGTDYRMPKYQVVISNGVDSWTYSNRHESYLAVELEHGKWAFGYGPGDGSRTLSQMAYIAKTGPNPRITMVIPKEYPSLVVYLWLLEK
jgi:hypothetical protein